MIALDGLMADRLGRRSPRSAADGEADNTNLGYALIQRQITDLQRREGMP